MAEYIDRNLCELLAEYDQYYTLVVPLSKIRKLPAADVAPVVHGKWQYNKDATDWGIGGYVCSECKNKNNNLPCNRVKSVKMFSGAKYCPNCGAKMDGGAHEAD